MSEALEIKIKVSDLVKVHSQKIPKRIQPVVYDVIAEDISKAVLSSVVKGKTRAQTMSEVTKIINKRRDGLRGSLRDSVSKASGRRWVDIAGEDSYGMTRSRRIEKSLSVAAERLRSIASRAYERKEQLMGHLNADNKGILSVMGIDASASRDDVISEIAEELSAQITGNISRSLGLSERALIKTESRAVKELEWRDEHSNDRVLWVLGENENHCDECLSYEGTIYETPDDAPMIPVHPNCACYLQSLEDSKEKSGSGKVV